MTWKCKHSRQFSKMIPHLPHKNKQLVLGFMPAAQQKDWMYNHFQTWNRSFHSIHSGFNLYKVTDFHMNWSAWQTLSLKLPQQCWCLSLVVMSLSCSHNFQALKWGTWWQISRIVLHKNTLEYEFWQEWAILGIIKTKRINVKLQPLCCLHPIDCK